MEVAMKKTLVAAGLLAVAAIVQPGRASAEERSFTVINLEYQGSKAFVPSTIVVHEGDTVKIKVVNNIPGDPNQHGFAIPEFKVEKVVTRGEPQDVQFVADKAGVFPIKCQLHPAHLGGELVVLPGKTAAAKK
jgi:plastocyanin